MEKRILFIDLDSERRAWEIYEKNHIIDLYPKKSKFYMPDDSIFGMENVLRKTGEIKGIFDANIGDINIKYAQSKKRFKEVADFVVLIDSKEREIFTGTFIDALEYIKKFFEDVNR